MSKLDRQMWCPDCRGEVIRRASLFARIAAIAVAAGLAIYVFSLVGTSPRFTIVYLISIAFAYLFTFKLTQRVAFELIRQKGVPPPIPKEPVPGEENG